jgi:hypothetical protein
MSIQRKKLFAIWLCLFLPISSYACFCVDSTAYEDHVSSGKWQIFKGQVVKNILDTNIVWGGRPFVATTFRVEVDYTNLDRPISCNKYTVRQSWSNCDKIFLLDSTYVVFASPNFMGFLGTSSCSPTRLFSRLSAAEVAVHGSGNREFEECSWREHSDITDPKGEELGKIGEQSEPASLSLLNWILIGIIVLLLLLLISQRIRGASGGKA